VSDEFPTLEAVLGVSNLVLAWRLWLLLRARSRVQARSRNPADSTHAGKRHPDLHRAARRKNRAGTDVAIAAVLSGALVYAWAAGFAVSAAFYALGVIAFVLLLASAHAHTRLARALAAEHTRKNPGRGESRSSADGLACPECGEARLTRVEGGELGPKLPALGVERLTVCGQCGHIAGRARPRTW
jgi:hypothetical protein